MRETRLSGSEGGAGSIPVPTPIDGVEIEFEAVARGAAEAFGLVAAEVGP